MATYLCTSFTLMSSVLLYLQLVTRTFCYAPGYYIIDTDTTINVTTQDLNNVPSGNDGINLALWLFRSPVNHQVQFKFDKFQFPPQYLDHHLEIGDGLIVEEMTELVRFRGYDLPGNVTSIGNTAWLRISLVNNMSNVLEMTVTATEMKELTLSADGTPLSLRTQNHPQSYPRNSHGLWNIRVPIGYVISALLDRHRDDVRWDQLYIGDGVDSFSKNKTSCFSWTDLSDLKMVTNFTTRSSSLSVTYTSESWGSRAAFSITVRALRLERNPANTTRNVDISNTEKLLITPYDIIKPFYVADSGPAWILWVLRTKNDPRIKISFHQLCFLQGNETLEIGDGEIVSESTRLAYFTGKTLPSDVTSITNSSWMGLRYPLIGRPPRINITVAAIREPEVIVMQEDGEIRRLRSPNFPANYPNNAYCIWQIEARSGLFIRIEIEELDTQEDADFLHIDLDGVSQFNTDHPPWIHYSGQMYLHGNWSNGNLTSNSTVTVIFTSDGSMSDRGFSIKFEAVAIDQRMYGYEVSVAYPLFFYTT